MTKKVAVDPLIVLIALSYGEISESKACELLGWKPVKVRDELAVRCGTHPDYTELMFQLEAERSKVAALREGLEELQEIAADWSVDLQGRTVEGMTERQKAVHACVRVIRSVTQKALDSALARAGEGEIQVFTREPTEDDQTPPLKPSGTMKFTARRGELPPAHFENLDDDAE